MGAVWYRLRSEFRTGWRALVVIAVLVGLAGGATLAALGAARRTQSAFGRMRQATNAWDLEVNPNDSDTHLTVAALRRLPGVVAIGRTDGVIVLPSLVSSVPEAFNLPPMLVPDRDATYTVGRPLMVAGHQPAPDDTDGVWVNRAFAQAQHLHVGQRFQYVIITKSLFQQLTAQPTQAAGRQVLASAPADLKGTARIEGIGVTPDGVVTDPGYTPSSIQFTPAFRAAHPRLESAYWGAMIKLRPGTDLDAFTASVQRLVPHESIAFQRSTAVSAEVTNATDPEVMALRAFAVLAALLGMVVVGQAVSRRLQIDARHNATLAAMGTTRPQRLAMSMAKIMVAVVAGAVLAVGVAVAASPLAPVGAVRIAEVHPGIHVDAPVLGLGLLAIVVVGAALAAISAWPSARVGHDTPVATRSWLATTLAGAGASVAAVTGVRFGLEPGSGRARVPVRTTLLAAATAVALVSAVVVFSSSLDHLLATPRLYGSAWDAQIQLDNLNTPGGYDSQDPAVLAKIENRFVTVADHSGSVASSALLEVGEVRSGAVSIPALGYLAHHPAVQPTIASGRAPASPDEVALGQTTMDRLHTHIGATIDLATNDQGSNGQGSNGPGPDRSVRVVGRAVLPGLAPYPGSDKTGLGVGALLTQAGFRRYSPDYQKTEYLFTWKPHASASTLSAQIGRQMPEQLPLEVDPVNHPSGVVSLQRLRATPTLLASLVALLLGAAVANALVVAVRRRRRDLAVLRTLGCTTGQVVRTVLWQATTVGAAAVVFGLPVGVILGRWTWTLLAQLLGMIPQPQVSGWALATLSVAVLVLVNLVGLIPGYRAAHHPGANLRTE